VQTPQKRSVFCEKISERKSAPFAPQAASTDKAKPQNTNRRTLGNKTAAERHYVHFVLAESAKSGENTSTNFKEYDI